MREKKKNNNKKNNKKQTNTNIFAVYKLRVTKAWAKLYICVVSAAFFFFFFFFFVGGRVGGLNILYFEKYSDYTFNIYTYSTMHRLVYYTVRERIMSEVNIII